MNTLPSLGNNGEVTILKKKDKKKKKILLAIVNAALFSINKKFLLVRYVEISVYLELKIFFCKMPLKHFILYTSDGDPLISR